MEEKIQMIVAQLRGGLEERLAGRVVTGNSYDISVRSGVRHALVYRPQAFDGPLPVLFDVHGGGFIYGCPEWDEPFCRHVCDELGIVVVSLSYRLAPEHRYPSDKEDVLDGMRYVLDHAEEFGIDPARAAICGHSAGGNIAASIALRANQDGFPRLRCVIMDYAPVDLGTDAHDKELPEGCIPPDVAAAFDACYRDPAEGKDPFLSPLYATDEQLRGLPAHVVITAEGDSLRGEGERYAMRLVENGVEVTARRFLGVAHGFTLQGDGVTESAGDGALQAKEDAIEMMVGFLRVHLLG